MLFIVVWFLLFVFCDAQEEACVFNALMPHAPCFFFDSLHLAAPKSRRVFVVVLLPWFLVLALRVCGALWCMHGGASNS